jgi:hypothetical protein
MEILNYDRVIKNEERCRRFMDLVKRIEGEEIDLEDDKQKPLSLAGYLVGPSILWARGSFNLNTIQVNKYNKLHVEIYSNIEEPIKIKRIVLRFNENTLNQELPGSFTISKNDPIILERELYISKDNQIARDFI